MLKPNYEPDEIAFIRKYARSSAENARLFWYCFTHDIDEGGDEFFELEIELYEMFPQLIDNKYVDFKKYFSVCTLRCVKLLALVLRVQNKNTRLKFNGLEWSTEICRSALHGICNEAIALLLPCIPLDMEPNDYDWRTTTHDSNKPERACVAIIKYAAIESYSGKSDEFWDVFRPYMNTGIDLHNEIILSVLKYLPEQDSDKIISYLCSDFDKTLFERTSGNKHELLLAMDAAKIHSKHCSDEVFVKFENVINCYISPQAKEILSRRIQYNRKSAKNGEFAYWAFWGDTQYDLLRVLPRERLSQHSYELLCVLERKYQGKTRHSYSMGHSGGVSSPISRKVLSDKQWLKIIFSEKLLSRDGKSARGLRWRETPGDFVSNDLADFISAFHAVVSNEPSRMIQLFLSQTKEMPEKYAAAFLSSIACCNKLNEVSFEQLEEIIIKLWQSHSSLVANSICDIIAKRSEEKWSQNIIDIVVEIAINHVESNHVESSEVWLDNSKSTDDFQTLESASWNATKGSAALAIAHLLREHGDLFSQLKDAIEKLTTDENPAIRLASLHALCESYDNDKHWVLNKCLELYEYDFRLIGHGNSRWLLSRLYDLYPEQRERVFATVKNAYNSKDENIVKQGTYWITESYINYGEFCDIFANIRQMTSVQAKAAISMASIYFQYDEYVEKSKEIISNLLCSDFDLRDVLSRLFFDKRLDLDRDSDFIIALMQSAFGYDLLENLVRFMVSSGKSLFQYHNIIIITSHRMLENANATGGRAWSLEKNISTLIIRLYDEIADSQVAERKEIAQKCLDLWDIMFEKQIGNSRTLAQKMLEG